MEWPLCDGLRSFPRRCSLGIGFLIVLEVQNPWANLDHPNSGARHIDSPRDAVGCESQSALVKWASTLANSSATYMLDLSQYTGERKRRGLDMGEFWKAEASDTLRRRSLILDP
jgi:hypothetical protein